MLLLLITFIWKCQGSVTSVKCYSWFCNRALILPSCPHFHVSARLRVCSSRTLSRLRALFHVGAWCFGPWGIRPNRNPGGWPWRDEPGRIRPNRIPGKQPGWSRRDGPGRLRPNRRPGRSQLLGRQPGWPQQDEKPGGHRQGEALGRRRQGEVLGRRRQGEAHGRCLDLLYLVLCGTQLVYSLAACFHVVMSCVNTWLMSFLISCVFMSCFAHGWWFVCWPCACVSVLCEHMASVLVFCVPCALMSICLDPTHLVTCLLINFPQLFSLVTLLICSLYNLLVFAVPCGFIT